MYVLTISVIILPLHPIFASSPRPIPPAIGLLLRISFSLLFQPRFHHSYLHHRPSSHSFHHSSYRNVYGEAEEDVLECTEMIAGTVFAGYKVTLMFEQEKTW